MDYRLVRIGKTNDMQTKIEQAVEAHRAGKLEQAEALYRAILKDQPQHPDANHNLGVLAVSANNSAAALPLLRAALEANPKQGQYWISYIEALIRGNQLDDARSVLQQGKKMGLAGEQVHALSHQLASLSEGSVSDKTQRSSGHASEPSQAEVNALLMQYQGGHYASAEKLAVEMTQKHPNHEFGWKALGAVFRASGRQYDAMTAIQKAVALAPDDAEAYSNLGNTLQDLGRLEDAEASYRQAIALQPDFAEAHYNLGNTLKALGRLEDAEASCREAIALKPGFAKAHNNLGNVLQDLGQLEEAAESYRQAIALKPDFAEAHSNLGIVLKDFGQLEEAEASHGQAITLKPEYAGAHSNLGNVLHDLGRLEEAEASYRQAIALKPDFAQTYSNLGITLEELGRLDEAEASFKQAIALRPEYAEAHGHLSKVLYIKGYKDFALKSIEKANHFDPKSKEIRLLLSIMKSRKSRKGSEEMICDTNNPVALTRLTSSPLILSRKVESELISHIYGMSGMELDRTKRYGLLPAGKTDARYGYGRCSADFNLFEDTHSAIRKLTEDLTKIMMEAVKSDIYIDDSFFNILHAGGGSTPHMHLNKLDKNIKLNLGQKKYSLVYYLAAGDQNSNEPGVLKLYSPDEDILPCEGMIVIIPAGRMHSSIYGGKTDRVMVGVNFYAL